MSNPEAPNVRTGQAPSPLERDEFVVRFRARFYDPIFDAEGAAIERLAGIAFDAYTQGRKAPRSRPAGPGYADPDYALSDEWRAARDRIERAQATQQDPATPSRVLVVIGASRNDGTCPGEISKSFRLASLAGKVLRECHTEVDLLDLSRLASDPDLHIHPCKACASTAMPLCHWPCSCYPNHGNGQVNDWMAEIYERFAAAHGVLLVTPVYWYAPPSMLKLMIDRLVCADGGNPDPTSTGGKDAARAKTLELAGWPYPKHLAGRAYGLVVHGDVAGVETVRRQLADWLEWMGFQDAGPRSKLDRFIGYWEPYATSHDALDRDADVQDEVRNVARALAEGVAAMRAGRRQTPGTGLQTPRPK